MIKGRDRTVFQSGGDWVNKRNDATRATSRHSTQADAMAAARENLQRQGGGEMTVQGKGGRFRRKDTISPGRDNYPPEG